MAVLRILGVFVALAVGSGAANASYLCLGEAATGMSYDHQAKRWGTKTFHVKDSKYTLKAANGVWSWNQFGAPDQALQCKSGGNDLIACDGGPTYVMFSKKTLRFQLIYVSVATVLPVEGKDIPTPLIEIGTCSNI